MIGAHPDAARSQLRAVVARLDRALALLPRQISLIDASTPADDLRASWEGLVALLALGPEPEVRECPSCGHLGMREATRCGYCWSGLSSLGPGGERAAVA